MTVYLEDINEVLLFVEKATAKNNHYFTADSLVFEESLTSNIKIENTSDALTFVSQIILGPGIKNLATSDTVNFGETVHPKVWATETFDILAFDEYLNDLITGDELTFIEVLTVVSSKVIRDQLVFVETLGLSKSVRQLTVDIIAFVESLTGYVIEAGDGSIRNIYCPPQPVPIFGVVVQELPVGIINGINTTFTLTYTPSQATSLQVYLNGLAQAIGLGNDYTFNGNTSITFNNPPQVGDVVLVYYLR